MKIKIEPGSLLYKVIFFIGMIFIKCWLKTLRVKVQDPGNYNSPDYKDENCLVVMWHNRIVNVCPLFHKSFRQRVVAMASKSKDGQIISDFLESFQIRTIRGSANKNGKDKGGAAALINSIRALRNGDIVSIIPDGPRGPVYEVQPGAIIAAAKAKVPILPVSINCQSCWTLKSWDRLQIAKPFSKVELIIGAPVFFEGKMAGDELEEAKERLKAALMDITVD